MHGAAEHAAYRNEDERNGTEQNTLDRTEHRTGAGNVEQLNKRILPLLHGDVVHTITLRIRGRRSHIRTEDALDEFAVHIATHKQDG